MVCKVADREQGSDPIRTLKGLFPHHIDVMGLGKEGGRVEATIRMDGHHSKSHRVVVICITHNQEESGESKALIERGGSVGRLLA